MQSVPHDNSGCRGYGVEVLWRRALWVMNPKVVFAATSFLMSFNRSVTASNP